VAFESGCELSCIESSVFCSCKSLSSISIPASVERLVRFYGCSSLSAVTFETGYKLSFLAADVFQDCSPHLLISIPSSLQRLFAGYQPRPTLTDVGGPGQAQPEPAPGAATFGQRGRPAGRPAQIQIPRPAATQFGQRGRPSLGRKR
jgi:hypothetical protein